MTEHLFARLTDVDASSAIAAKEAAEAAQAAAEQAEANAETAESNAEAAQLAAEQAQAGAEQAKSDAESAASTAQGHATTAQNAASAAEGFRDEAEGFRDQAEAFAQSIDPDNFYTKTEADAAFQPLNANLTTMAGLALTAFGTSWLELIDVSAARTALGLVIGTNVQAWSANLDAWSAVSPSSYYTSTQTDSEISSAIAALAAVYQPLNALLTDIAGISFAQGDILYYNGSNLVALSPGTAGQVLTTGGAGANPSWTSAAGGVEDGDKGDIVVSDDGETWTFDSSVVTAFARTLLDDADADTARDTLGVGEVLLNSGTLGSAAAALDIVLPSGYNTYRIEVQLTPASDEVDLYLRTSSNGGSTFDSGDSDYAWAQWVVFFEGSPVIEPGTDNSDSRIPLAFVVGTGSTEGASVEVTIKNPFSTTWITQLFYRTCTAFTDGNGAILEGMGMRRSSAAVDAIRILASTGNLEAGTTWRLYGSR